MALYNLDEYDEIPAVKRKLTIEVMMSNKSFCDVIKEFYAQHIESIRENNNHVDDEMLDELRGQLGVIPDTISYPSNTTHSNETLLRWIYAAKHASELKEGKDYVVEKLEDNFVKIIPLSFRAVPELDSSFANQKMEALLLVREMPWKRLKELEEKERRSVVERALTLSQLEKGVPDKTGKSTKPPLPEGVTEYISEFFHRSEAIRKGVRVLRDQGASESESDIDSPKGPK